MNITVNFQAFKLRSSSMQSFIATYELIPATTKKKTYLKPSKTWLQAFTTKCNTFQT